jgi:pyruvate/2-oxoglutarate dehydrogenase complex dihydrolipoamide acyltransferase (E2) component
MKKSFKINEFEKVTSHTAYRKIAIGTWKDAYDPSTYCMVEFEVAEAKKFLAEFNKTSKVQIKVVHLLAQAFSLAILAQPEINTVLRGKTLYRRKNVDAFHQVIVLGEGKDRLRAPDLSGISIKGTEYLSIEERVEQFNKLVNDTRLGLTEAVKVQKNLIKKIPNFIIGPFLTLSSFLIYGLNLKMPFLGITEDPFGSYMFSDTSSIRAPNAFIPLVPYARCGLLISTGKVYKKPLVENDQVVIREVLPLSITFDHRLVEGFQMAEIYRVLKLAMNDPAKYLAKSPVEVMETHF